MADKTAESSMATTCEESTSSRESVFPVPVPASEISSERDISDAQQRHTLLETSGTRKKGETTTDIESPPAIAQSMDELADKDVPREKEDAAMKTYLAPEENPYDRAMGYLHKHSLPSLFQYITINLAYQRPEDAIDFMIDEVTKRSQGQHEEMKMFE